MKSADLINPEALSILQIILKYFQRWQNEFFTWNASEWNGINQISVKLDEIWVPDISLYNKYEIVFSFLFINPFRSTGPFLCSLKTPENLSFPWFSNICMGYRKRPVAWNGLIRQRFKDSATVGKRLCYVV